MIILYCIISSSCLLSPATAVHHTSISADSMVNILAQVSKGQCKIFFNYQNICNRFIRFVKQLCKHLDMMCHEHQTVSVSFSARPANQQSTHAALTKEVFNSKSYFEINIHLWLTVYDDKQCPVWIHF